MVYIFWSKVFVNAADTKNVWVYELKVIIAGQFGVMVEVYVNGPQIPTVSVKEGTVIIS